jgi:hypothetical protein
MADASAFSPDYVTARARFRAAAAALGFRPESHPIGREGAQGEDLTVDVAATGAERPARVVVVSSGLHGVEGFFGSAVQAALLEDVLRGWTPPRGAALVLLHALNPFGFSWLRRANEENVDLNRNFLPEGEAYRGSPARYAELDWLLNPRTPPRRIDLFLARSLLAIARHGLPALKQAIAGGQYDFPRGLFFGGHGPAPLRRILRENLPRWIGDAELVLHVDFHSGLGRRGTHKLLLEHTMDPARERWLAAISAGMSWSGATPTASPTAPGAAWGPGARRLPRPGLRPALRRVRHPAQHPHARGAAGREPGAPLGRPRDPATRWAKRRLKDAFNPPDRPLARRGGRSGRRDRPAGDRVLLHDAMNARIRLGDRGGVRPGHPVPGLGEDLQARARDQGVEPLGVRGGEVAVSAAPEDQRSGSRCARTARAAAAGSPGSRRTSSR